MAAGLLDRMRKVADVSLDEAASHVRDAWRSATHVEHPAMESAYPSSYVEEVYSDHVIACYDGEHYSVPYVADDDGEVSFDFAAAVQVERSWSPVEKLVRIVKTDAARHLAFGWAYVAEEADGTRVLDHSDEFVAKEDLEDAAYMFTLAFREGDERHTEEVKAHLVESFVVTDEKLEKMGLAPDALPRGWWTGFYVPDDEVFAKITSGEYAMFSIGGIAEREAVDA